MRKILILSLLLSCLTTTAWAFTGVSVTAKNTSKTESIPFVDGCREVELQKNINSLFQTAAAELKKANGAQSSLSFQAELAKPTMLSVILRATGAHTSYKGMNMDTTTGKECVPKDFFYLTEGFRKLVPTDDFVFGEKGLLLRVAETGAYSKRVSYVDLLPYINIANAGRFLPFYKLTQAAAGNTFTLQPGELAEVYLESNPTTGYSWSAVNKNKQPGVVHLGNSFFLPNDSRKRVGGGGTEIFVTSFSAPGTYTVSWEYKRPWVGKAIETISYTFVVK